MRMIKALMTEDKINFLRGGFRLSAGAHSASDERMCAMELVAWVANEGHTDAPECVSEVLSRFVVGFGGSWSDLDRQKLLAPAEGSDVPGSRYLLPMIGTAGDGQDEARGYLALDWLVRTCTPAWLDLAGCIVEAAALRDLRRIVDSVSADAGRPAIQAANYAARTAANYASYASSDDHTARAVRTAADYAYDSAVLAARAVAARTAITFAAMAARISADYDYDNWRPTITMLQDSALDLLERMIDPASSVDTLYRIR